LLLVSHGGKILSIKPSELLEAQEAFEPEIFRTGYMERCWAPRELIARWFSKRGIPPPWAQQTRGTLRVGRGRPVGAINQEEDVALIDLALKIQADRSIPGVYKFPDHAAVKAALIRAKTKKLVDPEAERLRAKLRKRRRLRQRNKSHRKTAI
jgi:hypothetical protein